MAEQRKKGSTDEFYARSQWSDNMAFSRESIQKSKHKTDQLPDSSDSNTGKLPPRPNKRTTQQLDSYVSEMNTEIDRVSSAVNNRFDDLSDRFTHSVNNALAPVGHSMSQIGVALLSGLQKVTIGLVKATVRELTFVLRTLSNRLMGTSDEPHVFEVPETPAPPSSVPPRSVPGTSPLVSDSLKPKLSRSAATFSKLIEKKVFFSTLQNQPFIDENMLKGYTPGHPEHELELMQRALEEIRSCAPYGRNLPTAEKGPFAGIPMYDVLSQVTLDDIQRFLTFVNNRSQPFQQKVLKLSEAYATWAHKGAPEQ